MLSAWEPISPTRSTESSLCPGFHKSTGETFESISLLRRSETAVAS